MTQDEIIRMAREAGYQSVYLSDAPIGRSYQFLRRFAALVAAHAKQEYIDSVYEQHRETMFSNKDLGMLVDAVKAEREACAKVCDDESKKFLDTHMGMVSLKPDAILGATTCAAAIRARSEK